MVVHKSEEKRQSNLNRPNVLRSERAQKLPLVRAVGLSSTNGDIFEYPGEELEIRQLYRVYSNTLIELKIALQDTGTQDLPI